MCGWVFQFSHIKNISQPNIIIYNTTFSYIMYTSYYKLHIQYLILHMFNNVY